jgi:hypothetical protein
VIEKRLIGRVHHPSHNGSAGKPSEVRFVQLVEETAAA